MIDFNGLEYPWLFFVCVSRSHPDAAGAGAPTTIHRQMAVTLLASLAVHAVDTMERLASVGLGAMAIAILLVRLGETEFARFNGAFVTMLRYADAFCSGLVSSSMCVMLVVANQEEVAPILWTIYGVFCHVVLVVLTNRAPWHQVGRGLRAPTALPTLTIRLVVTDSTRLLSLVWRLARRRTVDICSWVRRMAAVVDHLDLSMGNMGRLDLLSIPLLPGRTIQGRIQARRISTGGHARCRRDRSHRRLETL